MQPKTVREMIAILQTVPEDKQDQPLVVACCVGGLHDVTGGFFAGTKHVEITTDTASDVTDRGYEDEDEDRFDLDRELDGIRENIIAGVDQTIVH